MTAIKHTPGPWNVRTRESRFMPGVLINDGVCGPDGEQIRVDGVTLTCSPDAIANAYLIAAAPELLSALKAVLKGIESSDEWWMDEPSRGGFDAEAIRAVITKATEIKS